MKESEEVAELARAVDGNLRAVRQALRQPVDAMIARGGLTGPQVTVMEILARKGLAAGEADPPEGMSLKELSGRVGLAHSTVSGIVDRLEKRGLVERQVNGTDRRFSKIIATKMVRDYVRKEAPELRLQPLTRALSRASATERRKVAEGLEILRRCLEGREPA